MKMAFSPSYFVTGAYRSGQYFLFFGDPSCHLHKSGRKAPALHFRSWPSQGVNSSQA